VRLKGFALFPNPHPHARAQVSSCASFIDPQQLENLTKLRSFRLIVPYHVEFYETQKQYLSQTILTHKSSALRSIELEFHCNHSHLTIAVTLNYTLTSLTLIFYDSPEVLFIYCFLPVLHTYRVLRRLCVFVSIPTSPHVQHA